MALPASVLLEVGRLAFTQLAGQADSLQATAAELSGVKLSGPLIFPAPAPTAAAPGAWSLAPLGSANGSIQAKIVDAALVFDADVTVPIRQGEIDFNDATVEHVGPDSRMGVSKLGLYVDAPNGRSYLYQFPAAVVAGVEFERRGALLGARVADRGRMKLQEFGEARMGQPQVSPGAGFTEQARPLFDRTALSGEVRLGDGRFAAPGVQAEFTGRAQGHNVIRLQSEAVGRGLVADIASLSVEKVVLDSAAGQMTCDAITGALKLQVFADGKHLRFELSLADAKLSGLRLRSA